MLSLHRPLIMGILNATPDSFYNKGRDAHADELATVGQAMVEAGAAILDVGGASTRPGAESVPPDEELHRVLPAIAALRQLLPEVWLSVDTMSAAVAKAAVEAGADIVNDVSAGHADPEMVSTVARLKVPYIAMHMQGTPATMQQDPSYEDVVLEVLHFLRDAVRRCQAAGIKDVILDPGFGFGKTVAHNFALLAHLHAFQIVGYPVLAGLSRKSMVCRPLGVSPAQALNGSTALHMVALQQGASILRVHDVREAKEVITLWEELERGMDYLPR
jgi:dihydropteroate synthase